MLSNIPLKTPTSIVEIANNIIVNLFKVDNAYAIERSVDINRSVISIIENFRPVRDLVGNIFRQRSNICKGCVI